MRDYWVYGIGFLAQILFGLRMIIQWLHAEWSRKPLAPALFWYTSLTASALFLVYGMLRHDVVIVAGQFLSYYIYVRNLQIGGSWIRIDKRARWLFLILPLALSLYYGRHPDTTIAALLPADGRYSFAIVLGGIGQALLNIRFLYQWWVAETTGESVLPVGFWLLSIVGCILLLAYAAYRSDPVLLISQGMGGMMYVRNLTLLRHARIRGGRQEA